MVSQAVALSVAVIIGVRVRRYRVVALLAGLTIAPLSLRFLYPNGELWDEGRFEHGKKKGTWKTYDKTGKLTTSKDHK